MLEVSIQLECALKAGTLSRLIRDIKLFGLQYTSHDIKHYKDHCEITINGKGVLNCSREKLIDILTENPNINTIKKLSITRNGEEITRFRTEFSRDYIHANEPLSEAVLLSAEKRLAEILGPVASFLVEQAEGSCRNAGELYQSLAEELNDDEEKQTFLSIIDDPV